MSAPKTISGHLKDLCKRDIMVAYDCIQWLAPSQRELDRRSRPKRLANRYIAACMIVGAAENPTFTKEVLDRTEGKVADRIEHLDLNRMVEQLEAARARVLNQTSQHMVVDGQVVEPTPSLTALTVVESKTSK